VEIHKNIEEIIIGQSFIVISDSNNFSMPCAACADCLISWIRYLASSIAALHFFDSFESLEDSLYTPKAASAYYSLA
jgi:hypothetical protein